MEEFLNNTELIAKVDSLGFGNHSFEWSGDKIYYISKSSHRRLHLGVVKLAEKAFAKGGFGKIYDVHSTDLDLVFKLSRKKIKTKRGEVAKQDICREYNIMRYIAENAADHTGLNCKSFGLHPYKDQMGIFLEKFDYNGMGYLRTQPSIESRREVIRQLFIGLDTLHRLNIVHRDLKLENTLIKGNVAVIADFGNACETSSFFTEEAFHPEPAALFGRLTKQYASALLVIFVQNKLKEIKDHSFGSKEYVRISKEVVQLVKRSDQFSMALQSYMIGTGFNPPFQAYRDGQYIMFDATFSGKEKEMLFDEISEVMDEEIKCVEITHCIKENLKFGLNF